MVARPSGDRLWDCGGVAVNEPDFEIEREDDAVVGDVIRQLRDGRDEEVAIKKRNVVLRDRLMQMLDERGGRVWDETSGLEAVITPKFRWEWDVNKLNEMKELSLKDFSDVIVTSVDKKKLGELIDKGVVRERMIEGAKVQTSTYEVISIKERKAPSIVIEKEKRNG